jgi:hypothetical protein
VIRWLTLALVALLVQAQAPSPEPEPSESPTPQRLLGLIRAEFRAHRPPPAYVTYTLNRAQKTNQGYPDLVNTYTYHVWTRTLDRASMQRKVFRDNFEYPPEFQRPAFNEDRDPGPPTADLFEPAPAKPRPVTFVPTPEPTFPPGVVIGRISTFVESDYRVTSVQTEGKDLHVTLAPIRDPDRNRLRELWVDPVTYELHKLVATDKLFITGGRRPDVYSVLFTVVLGKIDGHLVVTDIHGVVGDDYEGDGKLVDYTFRDIKFPTALPDWYFNARAYGGHTSDVPL